MTPVIGSSAIPEGDAVKIPPVKVPLPDSVGICGELFVQINPAGYDKETVGALTILIWKVSETVPQVVLRAAVAVIS